MATLRDTIEQTRADGRQRNVRCPVHDDRRASLSIGRGADRRILLRCHVGCATEAIAAAMGLTMRDLRGEPEPTTPRIVATYRYEDEHGQHLYDVVRFAPKAFKHRAPDGAWTTKGIRKVLYRLPLLKGQKAIFIVEGEKDADELGRLGLAATCNPGGASQDQQKPKWRDDYTAQIVQMGARRVCVIPDNDEAGRAHADAVARSCSVAGLQARVLALPDLPPKGDASDWLAAGGTKAQLLALVQACPEWTAAAASDPRPAVDLVSLDTLLAEPDTATEWLVQDRFARGTVNLLAGKPKAGKSTLARALALAVARGEVWLGSRCAYGRVVYVALEDKRSEVRQHLRNMGATGAEPVRFLIGSAPRTLLADLSRLIEAGDRIDLLIIDTAQRLLQVKDANDYALVTTAFEPVLTLARTHGTCIILTHHAGKVDRGGLDSVLGSTAWAASVDNIMVLNRTDRYRVLSSTQRIGPDLDEVVVIMDETTGDVRLGGSRYLVDRQAIAAAMVEAITEAGKDGLLRADLLAAVEARREVKLKVLSLLVNDPRITRLGAGTKNDPYRFVGRPEPASATPDASNGGSRVPSIEREPESLFSGSLSNGGSQVRTGSHGSERPPTRAEPDRDDDDERSY